MKFIDLHCDTLLLAYKNRQADIFKTNTMLDIERMKKAGQMAQFFAIFMPPKDAFKFLNREEEIDDNEYIEYDISVFNNTLDLHSDYVRKALSYEDLLKNDQDDKISAFLTFEDGRPINGEFQNIKKYYDKGVRLISLTWNDENCFGFPNSNNLSIMNKGLKDFGKEAISYMNELGILIDVSHLSDAGFYDVANLSKSPFLASHSNARTLSPHPRNLTDDMLRVLANKGGLVGINYGAEFLHSDLTNKDSKVEYMISHIKHMKNIAGVEVIALGSDFDGIVGNLEVNEPTKVEFIFAGLKKVGFTESEIEKIAYKNALRLIKDVL